MRKFVMLGLLMTAVLAVVSFSAPPTVSVQISPKTLYVTPGGDRQFSGAASGAMDTSVTWSTTGGTISSTGKYLAPQAPVGTTYTVTATSVADPTASATSTVIISNPAASVSSTSPNNLNTGNFTLLVFGANFMNGATVYFNGQPLTTSYVSPTYLSSTGNVANPGTYNVQVKNPYPAAMSQVLKVTVGPGNPTPPPPPPPPPVSVQVAPGSAGLQVNGTQQFTATVNNSANQAVTWKVNGSPNGDPTIGLISNSGLYTAPNAMISPNVVTISAVAAADGTTTGSATVTIQNPQAITLGRFLDQATFGPTPAGMAHLQQIGMDAWLTEQFGMPQSALPPSSGTKSQAIDAFFNNAYQGNDQLRQRVMTSNPSPQYIKDISDVFNGVNGNNKE